MSLSSLTRTHALVAARLSFHTVLSHKGECATQQRSHDECHPERRRMPFLHKGVLQNCVGQESIRKKQKSPAMHHPVGFRKPKSHRGVCICVYWRNS
eukprot:scaffold122392_cov18-Tisochrysis_lutea.AAC.1